MHIRAYEKRDTDQLLALFHLNCPVAFAPEEENDFSLYLTSETEDYFVLESEGRILACGGINYPDDPGTARISWDMVDPSAQGKGLGRELLDFRLAFLRQNPEIKLVTVRTSQMAYLFYEKAGFLPVEIIPDYWAEGFDLYRMERQL